MRLMFKVAIPNEPCNTMMKAGTFGPTMGRILDEIKPEAAYFTTVDSQRGGSPGWTAGCGSPASNPASRI